MSTEMYVVLGVSVGLILMLSVVGFVMSLNNKRLIDTTSLSNQDLKEQYIQQHQQIERLQAEVLRYQREVTMLSDKYEKALTENATMQRLYESLLKKN